MKPEVTMPDCNRSAPAGTASKTALREGLGVLLASLGAAEARTTAARLTSGVGILAISVLQVAFLLTARALTVGRASIMMSAKRWQPCECECTTQPLSATVGVYVDVAIYTCVSDSVNTKAAKDVQVFTRSRVSYIPWHKAPTQLSHPCCVITGTPCPACLWYKLCPCKHRHKQAHANWELAHGCCCSATAGLAP